MIIGSVSRLLIVVLLLITFHQSTSEFEEIQLIDDGRQEIRYYNSAINISHSNGRRRLNTVSLPKPIPLKETSHPGGGPVIATLLPNREKDIEELCIALRSLVLLKGDRGHVAPVLVFQEGDISDEQKYFIVSCTDRLIAFPYVDFKQFPDGFDFKVDGDKFQVKGRSEWGYYQMIRFWLTRIWEHPALKPYDTVMRIDTDSCFNEINEYLPNLKYDHLVYHSQYVGFEDGPEYAAGLFEFAENHLKNVNREPKNALLWQFIQTTWEHQHTLPVLMTNLEISKKSFMQLPEVKEWHEALTEKQPFGVLKKRWGDADIRFLTMAMFASHQMIMTERHSGYCHNVDCV